MEDKTKLQLQNVTSPEMWLFESCELSIIQVWIGMGTWLTFNEDLWKW